MAYNFNSPSPYSVPRKPPKWPWAFATVLLFAVIAATGLLLQNGRSLDGDFGNDGDLALVTPTPAELQAPTVTPIPSPTPVNLEYPNELATEWITLWMAQDYSGMYNLTSAATRDNMTQSAFVSKYADIQRVSGINDINVRLLGDVNEQGTVQIEVVYESGLVGQLNQEMELQMIQESQGWRVVWSPYLIFTDLQGNGCVAWTGERFTRGRILDSQGRVFAEDVPVSRVSVIPANITDPGIVYPELARVLDMDQAEIERRVEASPNAAWEVALKDMPASEEINLLNAFSSFTGITVSPATQRHYPYGSASVHLVGYVSLATAEDISADESIVEGQLIGRIGVEYGANDLLTGKPGGTLSAVECTSRSKRAEIASAEGRPPVDIYLTVDAEFQKQVDEALYTAEKEIDGPNGDKITVGQRGAVVILDPETGAVLAMVSHPSFDPNGYITQSFSEEDRENLDDPVMLAWLNRAVTQSLETGSIFKVITTAGGMHTLGYTNETLLNCPPVYELGGNTYQDWTVDNQVPPQGMLTLHQALVNSCNTVFYQIGEDMDAKDPYALPEMSRAFGLGEPVNIPFFPSSASGTIPDPAWKQENLNDPWATGDNVLLAIGQGFMTGTPMQMAVAYAAIANGGYVLTPYVVDRTQVAGEDPVQVGERTVNKELPLTDEQIGWLQAALRAQTTDPYGYGTSRLFGDFPFSISGKTGTAQNERANEGDRPHSWFAAYAPYPGDYGEADIASIVMVENAGEGVTYAAPVTKIIYQHWMDTHGTGGIVTDNRWLYISRWWE